MNWPLLIFLVLFFGIVFIVVIIDMVHEDKNKKSSFTISRNDGEYPWPRHGWPFL